MADLYHALTSLLVSRPHALGVVYRESHRLFLVDMLAGIQRGDEMLAMEMLGSRDQYSVNRFIIEEPPVVIIRRRRRRELLCVFKPATVNVCKCREIHSGSRNGFPNQLHPPIT